MTQKRNRIAGSRYRFEGSRERELKIEAKMKCEMDENVNFYCAHPRAINSKEPTSEFYAVDMLIVC